MNKLPRPFEHYYDYPNHVGMDYAYPNDTMVKASATGIVIYSGFFSDLGGYGVSVDYGSGVIQKYKHSDKTDWRASAGTRVILGSDLIEIGTSGWSTGYHLHHEVFINGIIQYGENYWKYVDKSPNGFVGSGTTAGDDYIPITLKVVDNMSEMYLREDDNCPNPGMVHHYSPGNDLAFQSVSQYKANRNQIIAIKQAGATDLIIPPDDPIKVPTVNITTHNHFRQNYFSLPRLVKK